jgi:hypothetical protein
VVPLDPTGVEALVIEYRPRVGFDTWLPAGGVLVTHRDLVASVRPPAGLRYRFRLLEADGDGALLRTDKEGGNRGVAGDAFGVGGAVGRLNALTTPALLRNATGAGTAVAIHSITVANGEARIRLSTSATPRVTSPTAGLGGRVGRPLDASFRVAGGFMPYRVVAVTGAPEGLEPTAVQDAVVFRGAPRATGAFDVVVRLAEAQGSGFDLRVPLDIGEFLMTQGRMLQSFLRTDEEALVPEEKSYLDSLGNRNGVFDVGDLRAWLRRE